jgi:fructuronate reductase
MVHLGLGNFHRAHQAIYTAAAIAADGGDWGIIGVASRSRHVVEAMSRQDLLYTVSVIAPEGTRHSIPAVHTEVLVGREQSAAVVEAIARAAVRIVTLTVTEAGYTFVAGTGELDVSHELVRHDLSVPNDPKSTIGQIVRGLQRRMRTSGAPITVLSCDNLAGNGHRTRNLVMDFARHLPARESAELEAWIASHVRFPCSMVDRIVPSTAETHRAEVAASLGYDDAVPVPAEPYTMWVIEDDFASGRPAWEAAGAVFSAEVDRYEELKLRLLNGTHSLIAYVGALDGHRTIPEAVVQEHVRGAAHAILRDEYLPTITLPAGVDVDSYERDLFNRWQNISLGHRTSQVGSDGSVKLPQRVCEPVLRHLASGVMPHYLALTIAAFVCCIAPPAGFDPGPYAREMRDPAATRLRRLSAVHPSSKELARAVFEHGEVFQRELAEQDGFVARVGELIDVLTTHGLRAAVHEAASAASSRDVAPAVHHRLGGDAPAFRRRAR